VRALACVRAALRAAGRVLAFARVLGAADAADAVVAQPRAPHRAPTRTPAAHARAPSHTPHARSSASWRPARPCASTSR
jgi:hypothetical protein